MHIKYSLAALAALAVLSAGCSDDNNNGLVVPQTNYNLEMTVQPTAIDELDQDDVAELTVTVTDVDTKLVVPNPQLDIAVSDTTLVTILDAGATDMQGAYPQVQAIGTEAGTANVTISFYNVNRDTTLTATIPVAVVPDPVASVEIAAATVTGVDDDVDLSGSAALALHTDAANGNDEADLHAVVMGALGDTLTVRPVKWMSLDAAVVAVDSTTGHAKAKAIGSTQVIATSEAFADTVTVNVTAKQP